MRLLNWRRQAVLNAMPGLKPDHIRTPWLEFWRRFRRQPVAMAAGLFVLLLIVVATFLFSSHDALSKFLAGFYPIVMVVWARYMVHTLLMASYFLPQSGLRVLRSKRPLLQVARALCLLGTSLFWAEPASVMLMGWFIFLGAAVGVEHDPAGHLAAQDLRGPQSTFDQVGVLVGVHRPTQDPPRAAVPDHTQIQPALTGAQVSDVGNPYPVQLAGVPAPVHQVGDPVGRHPRDGGDRGEHARADALETLPAH